MDDSKVVITYTNPRCHTVIYDANTNTTTVTPVTGNSDSILEAGEKFKVVIDFTAIDKSAVDPAEGDMNNVYTHPYEELRIEVQLSSGAKLTIERAIPRSLG